MSNHTLSSGDRVRSYPDGQLGTIAPDPMITAAYRGFVPVLFDGKDRAQPCSLDNLAFEESLALVERGNDA